MDERLFVEVQNVEIQRFLRASDVRSAATHCADDIGEVEDLKRADDPHGEGEKNDGGERGQRDVDEALECARPVDLRRFVIHVRNSLQP